MSTPPSTWHRFRENDVGDDTCGRCAVQVTIEAHMTFSLACPAGDCPSPKNPDRGCVFAPAGANPARCLFCGRSGSRDDDVPLEDLEPGVTFDADLDPEDLDEPAEVS